MPGFFHAYKFSWANNAKIAAALSKHSWYSASSRESMTIPPPAHTIELIPDKEMNIR